jgi:hypothetical protein
MLPSRVISDAPLDSRANVGPLNCFTVNLTAPRSLPPVRVGLEITTLIP